MSSIRKRLQKATAQHLVIAALSGMVFAAVAALLYAKRDWALPAFTAVATVVMMGAAFVVPLAVTLNLVQRRESHDEQA